MSTNPVKRLTTISGKDMVKAVSTYGQSGQGQNGQNDFSTPLRAHYNNICIYIIIVALFANPKIDFDQMTK